MLVVAVTRPARPDRAEGAKILDIGKSGGQW